mgnify:CR=1 FL=1
MLSDPASPGVVLGVVRGVCVPLKHTLFFLWTPPLRCQGATCPTLCSALLSSPLLALGATGHHCPPLLASALLSSPLLSSALLCSPLLSSAGHCSPLLLSSPLLALGNEKTPPIQGTDGASVGQCGARYLSRKIHGAATARAKHARANTAQMVPIIVLI